MELTDEQVLERAEILRMMEEVRFEGGRVPTYREDTAVIATVAERK